MGRGDSSTAELVVTRNSAWEVDEDGVGIMPRGLPRPLWEGNPIPYSSEMDSRNGKVTSVSVAAISPVRQKECLAEGLCLLCGEELGKAATCIVGSSYLNDRGVIVDEGVIDQAGLHERCAKMAVTHCPHLRDLHQRKLLTVFKGPRETVLTACRLGRKRDNFERPPGLVNITRRLCRGAAKRG